MNKRRMFLAVQGLLCLLLAVLLSAAAIRICQEGISRRRAGEALNWIYSREIAAERLAPLLPLLLLSLGMSAAGLALGVRDVQADRPVRDARLARDLAVSRVAVPSAAMLREQRLQRRLRLGGWAVFALCMLPVLLYLLRPAHFPEAPLEEMFSGLLLHTVPWTALGLGAHCTALLLEANSMQREEKAAREQLALQRKSGQNGGSAVCSARRDRTVLVRVLLLALALAMIAAGVLNGGMRDVLVKAINLCTECVGLG